MIPEPVEKAVLFRVTGQVQGVGYRYFAWRAAAVLGIRGHARNLADGSVEVLAIGTPAAVARFGERLKAGPPLAEIRAVTEREIRDAAGPAPSGFEIG
ncbi:MAG: acylphosphatase [Lentisphaeria bacterium]|jgi:acylphosphatase